MPNINTKFDNNRSSTFGDYLSNKNPDRQTETGDLFLRPVGVMKGRENVKVKNRPTDSITLQYFLCLRLGSKKTKTENVRVIALF